MKVNQIGRKKDTMSHHKRCDRKFQHTIHTYDKTTQLHNINWIIISNELVNVYNTAILVFSVFSFLSSFPVLHNNVSIGYLREFEETEISIVFESYSFLETR